MGWYTFRYAEAKYASRVAATIAGAIAACARKTWNVIIPTMNGGDERQRDETVQHEPHADPQLCPRDQQEHVAGLHRRAGKRGRSLRHRPFMPHTDS